MLENEPLYRTYAKRMLNVDELPESLEEKLAMAEKLVKKCKPCGSLSSTQSISIIILLWELEELTRKIDDESCHIYKPGEIVYDSNGDPIYL